jgi:hypothetical protein
VVDARAKLGANQKPFDFAIIDVMQEGKPHGLDLVSEIGARHPCVVVSAHVHQITKEQLRAAGNIFFIERNPRIWDSLREIINQVYNGLEFVEANRKRPNVLRARSHSSLNGAILVTRNWLNPASGVNPHEMIMEWDFAHLVSVVSVVEKEVIQEGGYVLSVDGVTCVSLFPEDENKSSLFRRAHDAAQHIQNKLNLSSACERRPVSFGFVEGQVMSGLFGERHPGISGVVGRTSDVARQLSISAKPGYLLCISDLMSVESKRDLATAIGNSEQQRLVGFSVPVEVVHIPLG